MKMLKMLAFVSAMAAVGTAQAATYSLDFQDVNFQISEVDANTFSLVMTGAPDASGDWASAVSIEGLGIKDMGVVGVGSIVSGPGAGVWTENGKELNANGCVNGGSEYTLCFTGSPVALTSVMSWVIDVTGTLDFASAGPHLKVLFLDGNGRKAGSLLSQNLPGEQVPVPGTLGLLGLGLAGLGMVRRKQQA